MAFTRRRFFTISACAFLSASCGMKLSISDNDSFDKILDLIHTTDVEFGGGLSNHAPMAAEALVALKHEDKVNSFVQKYATRLSALQKSNPLSSEERSQALGEFEKRAAWIASYEEDLKSLSPEELFKREWPTLQSGYIAAGWHGLLRTAHAIRSLQRKNSESRKRELAHALGFWASRHSTLPGNPGAKPEKGLDVVSALAKVKPLPASKQLKKGLIYPRFAPLKGDQDFVSVVESVDLQALPVEKAISDLTAAAARIFINDGKRSILFLHGVTGASALRMMLPWLDETQQKVGLGASFQSVAAALAAQGSSTGLLKATPPPKSSPEALRKLAANSPDEHTIKLVEAAIREYNIRKQPELLRAAEVWMTLS